MERVNHHTTRSTYKFKTPQSDTDQVQGLVWVPLEAQAVENLEALVLLRPHLDNRWYHAVFGFI